MKNTNSFNPRSTEFEYFMRNCLYSYKALGINPYVNRQTEGNACSRKN